MTPRVALGVRIAAALHGDVVLVGRPRGVVHLHSGLVSRSGGSVPTGARPLCGVRTRRLRVLGGDLGAAAGVSGSGRRFCRTCTRLLPPRLGRDVVLTTREDWVSAYDVLTTADLRLAAAWARTVDETWQVQTLLMRLHGPKPIRPATDAGRVLLAAYELVESRRHQLTSAAMTDEEKAAVIAHRETETFGRQRAEKARRRAIAVEKAQERARAGSYLLPRERELLNSA